MKINEKHLTAFASGTAPVDKEGFLSKRGEVNRAFQKRWFVLKGNLLFYYEKRGDREPLGVIITEGCTVELAENSDAYTFEMVFQGSGARVYVLAAEGQEEMESWMKAIACAGYDYMKLMVAELQRQMDELNSQKVSVASRNNTQTNSVNQAHPVPARPAPRPPPRSSVPGSSGAAADATTALLIDFGNESGQTAGSAVPMRQNPVRTNPFDGLTVEDVDLFAASNAQTTWFGLGEDDASRIRCFEEMHDEFGTYISKKLRDSHKKLAA